MSKLEARIPLAAIDDRARDGKYQFLADLTRFALGRWNGEYFAYPGGRPLEFTPTHFRTAERMVTPTGGADAEG